MIRCKTCLLPNTRPDTAFIQGECSACVSFRKRPETDWDARKAELLQILETAPKNGSGYSCVVPSSGGKDSTAQALALIELGARPLVVTATTCMLTEVGRRNIDNLVRYATTIEVTPNREVRRKLNRLGLEMVGDVSWPEHVSIFCTPFRIAADLGIPLIFYGESPQAQYGGPIGTDENRVMTRRWISEFGGHLGLRPADMVGLNGITEADMKDYMLPTDDRLSSITAYFLGQFMPWDSNRNAETAIAAGMECQLPSKANWWTAENQDNAMTGVHDHGMYRKFGFGRLCAQINVDIRNGLISREDAYAIVRARDGLFPDEYMDVTILDVTRRLGMEMNAFMAIMDKFTDWNLFSHVEGKRPILKEFAGKSGFMAA